MAKSKSGQSSKPKSSLSTRNRATRPSSNSSNPKAKSCPPGSKSKSSSESTLKSSPAALSSTPKLNPPTADSESMGPKTGPPEPNSTSWSEWFWSEKWQMCYRGRRDSRNEWEYQWKELPPASLQYSESDLRIIYNTSKSGVGAEKTGERGTGRDEGREKKKSGKSRKEGGKGAKGSSSNKKVEKKAKKPKKKRRT